MYYGSTRILNRVHDASGRLPLAAAGRMTGAAPSFGGLGDEAAAGDEVRGSDDSDEMVAAAAGLVLASTADACAPHELASRVYRGVSVPITGDHQRMRTCVWRLQPHCRVSRWLHIVGSF